MKVADKTGSVNLSLYVKLRLLVLNYGDDENRGFCVNSKDDNKH